MPEGDSVHRLARRLDAALLGRVLRCGRLNVAAHATAEFSGRTVVGHDTWGKHLLTRFDDGRTLHTHLRMDGSWTVVRAGRSLPRRLWPDVRVQLQVRDGPTAHGLQLPVVDLLATADEHTVVGHLGPDPLREDFDADEAVRRLALDPARPVKQALLDQRLVAGFGNLWANELCFLRGVDPWTPVGDVDLAALVRLGARALRASATVPGLYQVTTGSRRRGESHWVTGRAHRPCLRCGTPVQVRAEQGPDRRTWWCPHCQPRAESGHGLVDGGRRDRRRSIMASSVATVWVPVSDMDRALAFYRDTLALAVKDQQGEDWAEIDAGGLTIGLNGRETATSGSSGGAVISFNPDGSIDDEVARLREAGVEFTGEISDHPWGRMAPFRDSEGNDLQLYAPPA